ncbi:MAG: hypothetical protein RQ751_10565 [Longimicrobiales bacterium]|nr:hypothetical protein [Longimicrobiales bacterium]
MSVEFLERLLDAEDEAFEVALTGSGLSSAQRELGAAVLNMDPLMVGDDPGRVFADCLRNGEKGPLRQRLKELQSLIDKAERAGDRETLERCQRELIATKKRLQ